MYTATQFSSSADKEKFEKQFKKLVTKGFQRSDFPKWFYTRLSMTFSHIAHYDIHGFWETWFSTADKQAAFLRHTASVMIYGDASCTFSDVEKTIQQWVRNNYAC